MPITVRPLSYALGAEIGGVDLAKPLSNSEFDEIHRTCAHRVDRMRNASRAREEYDRNHYAARMQLLL